MISSYKKKLPSPPTRQILSQVSPSHSLDPQKKPWFQARKYLHLRGQDFKRFLEGKAPFNHYTQKLILKKHYRQARRTNKELLATSREYIDFYKSLASEIRKITYSNPGLSNLPAHREKIKSFRFFKHITTLNIKEYPNAFTPKNLQYLPNLKTLSISLTSSKLERNFSKTKKSKLKLKKKLCLDHLNLQFDFDCFSFEPYPYWILHCLSTQKELKSLNLDANLLWEFSHFSRKPIPSLEKSLSLLLSQKNLAEFKISLRHRIQNLLLNPDSSRIFETAENIQFSKNDGEMLFPITEQSRKILILQPNEKFEIPNMLNKATSLRRLTWHHSLASIFSSEQSPVYLYLQHLELLIADLNDFKLLLCLVSQIKISLESLSLNLRIVIQEILFNSLIELPALEHLKEFNLTQQSASHFSNLKMSYMKILSLKQLQNFHIKLPSDRGVYLNKQREFSLNLTAREDLEKFSKPLLNSRQTIHHFTANLKECPAESARVFLKEVLFKDPDCFSQMQEFHLKIDFDVNNDHLSTYNVLLESANILNSDQLKNLSIQIGNQKLITLNNSLLELEITNINDLKGAYEILLSNQSWSISACSIVSNELMDVETVDFLVQKFHTLPCLKTLKEYSLEVKCIVSQEIAQRLLLNFMKIAPHLDKISIQFPDILKLLIKESRNVHVSLENRELIPVLKHFLEYLNESVVEEFSLTLNEGDDCVGKALKELNTSACLQNVSKYSFFSHFSNNNTQSSTPKTFSSKSLLVDPIFLADFQIPLLNQVKSLTIQCSKCVVISLNVSNDGKRHCEVQFQSPPYLETFTDFVNDLGLVDNFELTITEPDNTIAERLGRLHQHPNLKGVSRYSLKLKNSFSNFSGDPVIFREPKTLYKMHIHALKFLQVFSFSFKGKSKITLDDLCNMIKDLERLRDFKVSLHTQEQHPLEFSLSSLERIENLDVKLNFQKAGIENLCRQLVDLKSLKRLSIESVDNESRITFKPAAIAKIFRSSPNFIDLTIKTYQQTFTQEDLEKYNQNEINTKPFYQKFRNQKRHY